MQRNASHIDPQAARDPRGVSILAKTLVKEMREQGFSPDQIVSLSSELLHLVSSGMRSELAAAE